MYITAAETIFIVATSLALVLLAVFTKNIDWGRLGFRPPSLSQGWSHILAFTIVIFTLVQFAIAQQVFTLPEWIVDKDPLLPLLSIVFLQEVLFRGLAISWLERFGAQRAVWISTLIFVLFHMVAPYTWSSAGVIFAGITFVGGYFWGWHFLKFRNIYLLTISHLFVNLSFNYLFF